MSTTQQQIGELIPKLMKEIGAIGKDRKNSHQHYNFRGIDDVLNHVGPPAAALGLRVETGLSEYQNERVEWEEEYRGDKKQKFRVHVSLKLTLRFVAPDGSAHVCEAYGEGQDTSGDKATNKAMSAAFKYAVFMGLVIPVDGALDDSDNDAKQPDKPASNPGAKPASKAKPAAKEDPRVTIAKRIEADKDAHWFEVVAWEKGDYANETLGSVASRGEVKPIQDILNYIDEVVLDYPVAARRLQDAIAKAKTTASEKAKAAKARGDEPADEPDIDRPF